MDQTLYDAYTSVTSQNLLYQRNRNRWQFLLESYIGGQEYRNGGHLTRYVTESDAEYGARLHSTPLDNHCRSVVQVYTSFLFRDKPDREYGTLANNSNLENILTDSDLDGRSLDNFMREVATWSNVFGHTWVMVVKPQTNATTRADELSQGIRPYVNLITPLTVTDWTWKRETSGAYSLTYFKYVEEANDSFSTIREWTLDTITTTQVNHNTREVVEETVEPNGLGRIPAVICYATRSPVRGIGASAISDIADSQRMIYNLNSEVEQSIRINGHPTLVKTVDVEASAGAGSIALMPDGMDPGLKPYLLNVSTDINQIYTAINSLVESIDKMANTGAIRAVQARTTSGVAMESEFQLLNARLSEMADNLQLAEEQIWRWIAIYEGTAWDGHIEYPNTFNIRDKREYLAKLQMAMDMAGNDPILQRIIEFKVRDIVIDDTTAEAVQEEQVEQNAYIEELANGMAIADTTQPNSTSEYNYAEHATTTASNRSGHIQQMIMDGYTDAQILEMHPEISQQDIVTAKQQLLNLED
jgi:hypothetical protein